MMKFFPAETSTLMNGTAALISVRCRIMINEFQLPQYLWDILAYLSFGFTLLRHSFLCLADFFWITQVIALYWSQFIV